MSDDPIRIQIDGIIVQAFLNIAAALREERISEAEALRLFAAAQLIKDIGEGEIEPGQAVQRLP